jgi:hypothetical protein
MPEMVLSPIFRSIAGACFRAPHGTVQNLKCWFLWYLVLRPFTCTSLPVQNLLSLVFKVRQSIDCWVFRQVDYPFLLINTLT